MWNREPALIIGAIQAAVALAVGFGLRLSADQVGLLMALVSALAALATRQRVSPAS